MREYDWNNVIWSAINELKYFYNKDYFNIDKFFSKCENKLISLEAPEREIKLRLFALALHCDKNNHAKFFKSVIFARFSSALDFLHFERITKKLIEEHNLALVVYWVVLRCSLANSLPRKVYLPLEREIKQALLN